MRNRALVTALIVCHISTTLNPSTEQWGQSSFRVVFLNSYATLFHEFFKDTLYNAILRIVRNFLETKENIKISTHPFYHINLD